MWRTGRIGRWLSRKMSGPMLGAVCGVPAREAVRPAVKGATWRSLAAAAILAVLSANCASASDFYVRGGIGVDRLADGTFTDLDCASKSPDALYGCGPGGDGASHRSSKGDFGITSAVELGIGYAVSPALRLEGLVEYRPRLAFRGRSNFLAPDRRQTVEADLRTLLGMVAAHVDLPALGVPKLGPFSPTVGAGVGVVRTRVGEMEMTFPRTMTVVPGATRTDRAWMVTAGLAAALGERTTLELAWRYSDLGEAHTGRGAGRVVWQDGSREPLALDLAATRATLRSHGLRLSIRYAF